MTYIRTASVHPDELARHLADGYTGTLGLTHAVRPYLTAWRARCGLGFHSREVDDGSQVVTCLRCLSGIVAPGRFG